MTWIINKVVVESSKDEFTDVETDEEIIEGKGHMHSVLEMSEEDSIVCVNDKHKENYGKNIKWMLTCNAKLDKFKKYIVKIVNKSEMSRWVGKIKRIIQIVQMI